MKTPDPLVAGPLRIVWLTRGDRLGHRLEWVPNGGADEPVVRLLESIDDIDDGGTTDDWPASPPLADWHIEERAGDRVLMAVGRAGRSHWSVVVTAAVAHAAPDESGG